MRQETRQQGFKVVDLMIGVTVVGVLAAIAVPNYASLRRRAQEATIKANMHTLQIALEDFAVQNESFYPTSAMSALPDGRTLTQLFPTGEYPVNPFTKAPSVIQFNADPTPGQPGELAVHPAQWDQYRVKGNGPVGDSLSLVLSSGQ